MAGTGRKQVHPEGSKYINILFEPKQLSQIDDFRFKNRFNSRTEAIRVLINYALKQRPRLEATGD